MGWARGLLGINQRLTMAVVTSLHFDSLDEPLRSLKLSLLKDLKDAYTTWQSSTDTPIPVSFLRACRLYHSDHLEVYFSRAPKRSLQDHFSAIISPQNELRVLTFLRKTIAQVADETLQSSLTEALQLLADAYLRYVNTSLILLTPELTDFLQPCPQIDEWKGTQRRC